MMSNSIKYWVYGTLPAALLLMGLLPAVRSAWSVPIILVYLQLPIYMLHQVEEHTSDRFLRFVNQTIGHGKEIITLTEIFWINVPGVWGLNLLSFLLAYTFHLGLGLISIYLCLVNAVTHLIFSIVQKQYNPGLLTALFLFLPISTFSLMSMTHRPEVNLSFHILGIGLAILIQVYLIIYFRRKLLKIGPLKAQMKIAGIQESDL
jgi:hypothetical protein